MKRLLWFLLFAAIVACFEKDGRGQNPVQFQPTPIDPTGQVCGATRGNLKTPDGSLFTCQNGVMAKVSGGGGGVPGGANHDVQCNEAAAFGACNTGVLIDTSLVFATSPGAGVAHFAGGTQQATSSLVVTADITNANVTAAKLVNAGVYTGDVSGTFPATTVIALNGTTLSGLATGILKNTTGTGVPSIAGSADILAACTTCVTSAAALTNNGVVIGQGLQASATIATANNAVLVTSAGGVPSVAAPTAPLAVSASALTCATCATTTNGGALSATLPITLSAAGVIAPNAVTGTGNTIVEATTPTITTPNITTSTTLSNNGIGAVSTDGYVSQNTTAAAAGAQQFSPRVHFIGQGWKTTATAASQQTEWYIENEPIQDTTSPDNALAFVPLTNAASGKILYLCTSGAAATTNVGMYGFDGQNSAGAPANCRSGSINGFGSTSTQTNNLFAAFTNGSARVAFSVNGTVYAATSNLMWTSTTISNQATGDTGLCRNGIDVLELNDGSSTCTNATAKGLFARAGDYSAGTTFTASGCSNSTLVGGATAGTYTSGTTGTCTVVITMNGATGLTAPNGWDCAASDRTTPADKQQTTTSTQTTATISGTTVSGDVISFHCDGY